MRCIAKYCGEKEKFGVKPGEIHAVELNTYSTKHGSPYLWVSVRDRDDYLMPFSSLGSMLREWMFVEQDNEEEVQDQVETNWLETYFPGRAVPVQ